MIKDVRTPAEAEELRNVVLKISRGDPITDEELKKGIQFLDRLEQDLDVMGPAHSLSRRDVREKLSQLETFQRARREKW